MDLEETDNQPLNNNNKFSTQLQNAVLNIDLSHLNQQMIEAKLYNIRNVTKQLIEKAKWIEARRKYLESKNYHLKNENEDLSKRFNQSQEEICILHKKLQEFKDDLMESTLIAEESKMLLEYAGTMQGYFLRCTSDKAISCHMLSTVTKSTQTHHSLQSKSEMSVFDMYNQGHHKYKNEMILTSSLDNAPVIIMSKKELRRLDSNLEALRMKLAMKEVSWAKTAEREREQRSKLYRISNEMTALKKLASSQSHELSVKTRDLKMTKAQLDNAEIEIKQLKKIILKTRTSSTCLKPQVTWSGEHNVANRLSTPSNKKRKIRSKKLQGIPGSRGSNTSCQTEKSGSYALLAHDTQQYDAKNTEINVALSRLHTATKVRRYRQDMTPDRLLRVESDTLIKSFEL